MSTSLKAISLPLDTLKLKTLSQICVLTGLPTSGTKPTLLASLKRELPKPRLRGDGPFRVLSIDMGIRNLAYACLDVRKGVMRQPTVQDGGIVGGQIAANATKAKRKGEEPGTLSALDALRANYDSAVDLVKLVKWDRIGIFDLPTWLARDSALPLPPTPPLKSTRKNSDTSDADPVAVPTALEHFTPAALAPLAYHIVTSLLLPLQPDVILIERQRHRSGGGAAILEWTFRVNMLESMLYAVLTTLKAQASAKGPLGGHAGDVKSPEVRAMDPKRVSGYWAAMNDADAEIEEGAVSAKLKQERHRKVLRIGLAEGWLASGRLDVSGQALATQTQFLSPRRSGRRVTTKGKRAKDTGNEEEYEVEEESGLGEAGKSKAIKRDDLADALVQGVAFVQWEANRQMVCDATGLG